MGETAGVSALVGRRVIARAAPVELRATLAPLGRGPGVRAGRGLASRSCARALRRARHRVRVRPADERVTRLHRNYPGLRMTAAGNPVELMVPTILEQKVTSVEAHRAYGRLVRAHGHPAPGSGASAPRELMLPPTFAELAALPSFAGHACGVERRRVETVREVCRRAPSIARVASKGSDAFQTAIVSIPGIGVWTATMVAQLAFGDPDAVVMGDFHLPTVVAWNLAGEREADDTRMLALLEPFRPHRARVVALIAREGSSVPRRAPKRALRDIRRI